MIARCKTSTSPSKRLRTTDGMMWHLFAVLHEQTNTNTDNSNDSGASADTNTNGCSLGQSRIGRVCVSYRWCFAGRGPGSVCRGCRSSSWCGTRCLYFTIRKRNANTQTLYACSHIGPLMSRLKQIKFATMSRTTYAEWWKRWRSKWAGSSLSMMLGLLLEDCLMM